MSVRTVKGVLTPSLGYICYSCRLQSISFERGRTRRYQHAESGDRSGGDGGNTDARKSVWKESFRTVENAGDPPVRASRIREIIRGFGLMPKAFESSQSQEGREEGSNNGSKIVPCEKNEHQPTALESTTPNADLAQQKLQQKFSAQRVKELLAMQDGPSLKADEKGYKPKDNVNPRAFNSAPSGYSVRRVKARASEHPRLDPAHLTRDMSKRSKEEARDVNLNGLKNGKQGGLGLQRERSLSAKAVVKKFMDIMNEVKAEPRSASNDPPESVGAELRFTMPNKALRSSLQSLSEALNSDGKDLPTENERKEQLAPRKLKPILRKIKGNVSAPLKMMDVSSRSPTEKHSPNAIVPTESTPQWVNGKTEAEAVVPIRKHVKSAVRKHLVGSDPRKVNKEAKDGGSLTLPKHSDPENVSDASGSESLQTKTKPKAAKSKTEIEKANAQALEILPVEVEQAPVPSLSYGLERVLFNPGVYQLQDPRSRVYNFDPYLQTIMPVADFDFNALKEYITSSRDESLKRIARVHGKRYVGSTSSMTAVLSHFHFLLSQWRPIDTSMLSKAFPANLTNFTELSRIPSAIFLRWKDGTYAIDADKQFDSANVLSMLGKSMEKLLTLNTEDYERYRKSSSSQVTDKLQFEPETYHYSTMGDFLMRSQLDAHDPRLPGTGMFDLKTRAVVSIRMDVSRYEHGLGYQIKSRQGEWESYEREYYDMIRAAFLKYSMQVRMGRMDGIFVAFHNVENIFGFQYISLPEMDSTIHGQWDTSIGDQEFKLSLDLLNKILDKATARFPETSIRLHFETRDASTPFMYIFAEPVTEEQVVEIQTQNAAKIEEFERNILGLTRKQSFEAENSEEDESKWDNIQADVQEAMAQDEMSVEETSEDMEANDEDVDADELALSQRGAIEANTLYANKARSQENDRATIAAAESEDNSAEDTDDDDSVDELQADEESEELDQDGYAEVVEEVDEKADEGPTREAVEETDEEEQRHAEVIPAKETRDHEELAGLGEEADGAVESTMDDERIEISEVESRALDQLKKGTSEDVVKNEDNTRAKFEEGSGEQLSNQELDPHITEESAEPKSGQDRIATISKREKDAYVGPMPGEEPADSDFETEADQPFLDSITGELAHVDPATSSTEDILALTLTVRNKVNGKFVLRPHNLRANDNWSIEYSLEEVSSQQRARALYEACQQRRKKKLDDTREEEALGGYLSRLRELSAKGKQWREKVDKEDRKRPVQVLGREVPKPAQGGGLTSQKPDA